MSGTTLNINTFDAIVLGILFISGLVAFFRGFIRELLSLGAWVGAAIITIYLYPHTAELLKNHIHGDKDNTVAAGVGALGTYIAALLFITIINSIILRYVKTGSEVGLLDNFLGLLFGLMRGAFIISLGYLIMASVIPRDNPPEWIKTSVTRKYVESGATMLANAAPNYLSEIEGFIKKEKDKARNEQVPDTQTGNPADKISGYNPNAVKNFDQIINQRLEQQGASGGNN